jgi:FG-GAP repeat/IPTL-CTERM motif
MNVVLLSSLAICYSSLLPAFPDCNNNGIDDEEDIANCSGDSACKDCNDDGRPDGCGVMIGCDLPETQELIASDAARYDEFGRSVSVSGDVVFVGAPSRDCGNRQRCGVVNVYRLRGSTWVEEQKLMIPDGESDERFGSAVYVSGTTAIVGARSVDCDPYDDCGAAYVFTYDGVLWVQIQKLTASDASAFASFGVSVALSGDIALIGAYRETCSQGLTCGASYVFRYDGNTWVEEQKLIASDRAGGHLFGGAVAVSGSVAVVGARRRNCEAGSWCGATYIFRYHETSWIEEQILVASDPSPGDSFGESVAIQGDTALVGAAFVRCSGNLDCGAAYAFSFNGVSWIQQQELATSLPDADRHLGSSLALSGDTAVIGARRADCLEGESCGSAHVFHFDGTSWVEHNVLAASVESPSAHFGRSVSISQGVAVVGASNADCLPAYDCDTAHIFDIKGLDCNCNAIADRCELSEGAVSDCNENSVPDDCEADCNTNGLADDCDIRDYASPDCNSNGTPDECELDCNNNGIPDSCDLQDATSSDCNVNGQPDECEPDCNSNGIPDECDITSGTTEDCNFNGVPDSCDLRDGTSVDIDGDGLIDDCDSFLPIPTVSEWGLGVLALLLLILGKVAFRRRGLG